jgi:hypothetical protein
MSLVNASGARHADRSRRSQGDAMQIGQKLGAYEVIAKIGEGGMGEVRSTARATRASVATSR